MYVNEKIRSVIMMKLFIIIFILFAPVLTFAQGIISYSACVDETIEISHPDGVNSNWELDDARFDIIGSTTGTDTLQITCLMPGKDTILAIAGSDTSWFELTVSDVSANFSIIGDRLNASIINVLSDSLFEPYVFPITFKWDFDDGTMEHDTVTANTILPGEIYRSAKRHDYSDEIDTDSIFEISLVVKNGADCYDSVQMTDTLHQVFTAPNIFTPNNDGMNDHFTVRTSGNVIFSMKVFSRWGNIVFESEQPSTSQVWDGRLRGGQLVSSGVYFYVIESADNANAEKLTGFVHVMTPKQ